MTEEVQSLKQEIAFLKQQLEVVADGVTEQKYLQQAKRMRELSVKLDSEKARVAKLQQTIIKHERLNAERTEAERKGVLMPSAAGGTGGGGGGGQSAAELELKHATSQLSDMKSKLDRVTAQNASLRAQIEKHDRDTMRIKKVLLSEIGDEVVVEKVLSGGGGGSEQQHESSSSSDSYRGRAQQISLLQTKVKDLTRKLHEYQAVEGGGGGDTSSVITATTNNNNAPSVITSVSASGVSTTIKDYDATHRSAIAQQESKKSAEIRQLQQHLDEAKEATTKEKQRGDALASRIHVLEKQLQQYKSSIQQVVQKTENDNKLIDAYRQELENQRSEIRQLSSSLLQLQHQGSSSSSPAPHQLVAGSQSVAGLAHQYPNSVVGKQESSSSSSSQQKDLQRIASLENEVSTLQRQIAMMSSTSGDDGGDKKSNKNATDIVESQRKMILNLEQKLQNMTAKMKSNNNNNNNPVTNSARGSMMIGNSSDNQLLQNLRDENASLKERMSAMTGMVEREVELKKAQLQAKYDQMMKEASAAAHQQQQQTMNEVGNNAKKVSAPAPSSSTTMTKQSNTTTTHRQHRTVRSDANSNNNNNDVPPPPPTPPPQEKQPRRNIASSTGSHTANDENNINERSAAAATATSSDEDEGHDSPPLFDNHNNDYDDDNNNNDDYDDDDDDDDDDDNNGDREIPGAISSRSIPVNLGSRNGNNHNNNNNHGARTGLSSGSSSMNIQAAAPLSLRL